MITGHSIMFPIKGGIVILGSLKVEPGMVCALGMLWTAGVGEMLRL